MQMNTLFRPKSLEGSTAERGVIVFEDFGRRPGLQLSYVVCQILAK